MKGEQAGSTIERVGAWAPAGRCLPEGRGYDDDWRVARAHPVGSCGCGACAVERVVDRACDGLACGRARLTLATAIVAVVTLISVPLSTDAGEWLERRVERTPLLSTHTQLGDTMLPWAIGLAVIALAALARQWHATRTRPTVSVRPGVSPGAARMGSPPQMWGGRGVSLGLAVVAVVVAVGSVFTVYEIGDSGARAAWQGKFSQQPQSPPPGPPPAG
jgi:hypothetical protein